MIERRRIGASILQCLAECEMEVEPILLGQVGGAQRALHHRDRLLLEAIGLEIGEAPPNLPQRRLDRRGLSIGCNRILVAADRLQRMAIAHPVAREIGEIGKQAFVDLDRRSIFAQPHQGRGLDGARSTLAGIFGEQDVDLRQRFLAAVVALQDHRIGLTRRIESGCERLMAE